jgi:hypothetical protein
LYRGVPFPIHITHCAFIKHQAFEIINSYYLNYKLLN